MILWLASYPKAGNTWLRHVLGCYRAGAAVPINDLREHGLGMYEADPTLYERVAQRPFNEIKEGELPELRRRIHAGMASGRDDLLCKTHSVAGWRDGRPMLDPAQTAGAVYIVRDPRAVAVSWAHHASTDLDGAIDAMAHERRGVGEAHKGTTLPLTMVSSWSAHLESWGQYGTLVPVLMVKYEDMRTDPVPTFTRIINYIGGESDPVRIKRAVRDTSFDRVQADERDHGFNEAPPATTIFRQGTVDGWRQAMSRAQRRRIEHAHHDMMARVGYI